MVRDLLVGMEQGIIDWLSKDNRGRPLYIFVGYTTKLKKNSRISNFPLYQGQDLSAFQNLYQQILQVWWLEEYQRNSKQPILDPYQTQNFENHQDINLDSLELARQINHQGKYPHQTYLWQNTSRQKQRLWISAAACNQPLSVCLGDQSSRDVIGNSSPFLNQTVVSDSAKVIEGCAIRKIPNSKLKPIPKREPSLLSSAPQESLPEKNLSEMITDKVRDDIETTIHHAKKVGNQGRGLWRSLGRAKTTISNSSELPTEQQTNFSNSEHPHNLEDFGFKTKSKSPAKLKPRSPKNNEWF